MSVEKRRPKAILPITTPATSGACLGGGIACLGIRTGTTRDTACRNVGKSAAGTWVKIWPFNNTQKPYYLSIS
jgi:hypothetical protein